MCYNKCGDFMKVLLISINAKYIHTNNAVRLLKANCDFPVDIFEYTIKDPLEKIIRDIEEYNPDVLGFSCYIWNISLFIKIIDRLSLDGSKIIMGGPEVSYDATYFLNKYPVDVIIKGEGEKAFNSLIHAYNNNADLVNIPSISYNLNNIVVSNPIKEITDLNTVILPYYYDEDKEHIKHKISYIESSRGCPYKCSYCLSSLEKTVRFFDLDKVKEAILYLMSNGSKIIKFLDRTFNANKNTLELLDFIIKNNNSKTVFQFEITGDVLDPKIIEYLNLNAPKGLFRFEIGIQSINEATNLLVDRFQDTNKLFSNIKKIQDGNIIDLHLDLIAGLPNEDLDSFIHTFNEVFKLGAKELQLGFLKMLRGTKIRIQAKKYDYEFDELPPYQITRNNVLDTEDIDVIHNVEHMLEIYHNKGYFKENMHNILLNKKNVFMFLSSIDSHYKENSLALKNYQIEDVYKNIFPLLSDRETFLIKQDYLRRSKIKPKLFFPVIRDKDTRKQVFTYVAKNNKININELYKNSVVIEFENEYFVIIYKNGYQLTFKIKEDIN